MNKYLVVKIYSGCFSPTVIEEFSDLNLACMYRDVLKQNHPDSNYAVYELVN